MYYHNAVCCRQVSSASRIFVCLQKVEVLLALKGLRKRMKKVLHLLGKHLKKMSYVCFLKRSLFECLNTATAASSLEISSLLRGKQLLPPPPCRLVSLHSSPPLHPLHSSSPRQSSNFWLLSTLILYNHPTLILTLIAAAYDSFFPRLVDQYIILI